MFFLSGLLNKLFRAASKRLNATTPGSNAVPDPDTIASDLLENIAQAKRVFPKAPDLIVRRFAAGPQGTSAAILYLEGLTDKNSLNSHVLRPLMYESSIVSERRQGIPYTTVGGVRTVTRWKDAEDAILQGQSVLFLEGRREASVFETSGWPQRAIEDPQTEASLKGAHQGFVETGMQNVALLRRYLPNRELQIEELQIGRRGKAKLWIMYLRDVADPNILTELQNRINAIDVDAVINTGELAEYIEDHNASPFPQLIVTERPDSAMSQLLQGRFVVIMDRSPSVIVAPATFSMFFQNIDDYSTRWLIASFIRLLRFAAFFLAMFLPAIYIALISYNYEVIPLELLLSIAESRERVPFSPLLEAFMMEITLEMMREAGIRLPAPIGQTIGIVGGIVIGQAAVQAGIVSNIMVIVVATTAIASFILPSYDMGTAVRLLRFPMMIMASLFGIVGIMISLIVLIAHLVSMESLGTPYGSPIAPFRWQDMKDTFIRAPLKSMINRPKNTQSIQSRRLKMKPPPKEPS